MWLGKGHIFGSEVSEGFSPEIKSFGSENIFPVTDNLRLDKTLEG